MADEQYEALDALRDIAITATVVGADPITAGYVWSEDYDIFPQQPKVPFVMVGRLAGVPTTWQRKAYGLVLHEWTAEIVLALASGTFEVMDTYSAAAEAATRGWELALNAVLWSNQTLAGKALGIGRDEGGLFTLMRTAVGHIPIGTNMFWGIRSELVIRQTHQLEMGSGN